MATSRTSSRSSTPLTKTRLPSQRSSKKKCELQDSPLKHTNHQKPDQVTCSELPCQKESICLEILPSEGSEPVLRFSSSNFKDRPSSGNKAKKAPPVNRVSSATTRTPTPTKQIILEAAKRKQESILPFDESIEIYSTNVNTREQSMKSVDRDAELARKKDTNIYKADDDKDEDDEEDSSSSSEEETVRAPNELMMEFLDCIMKGDYTNGLKLCSMILLYEPENAQAVDFKSVIEDKIAVDASNQDSETDEDDDAEDDEHDDDEEDEEDNSSEDDSDSEDSEEDEDEDDDKDDTNLHPFQSGHVP